eukprot:scaffold37966_cov65-Cyclotella_meneghiniana.AAC.3
MTSITSAASMKLLDLRLKHSSSIITSSIGEFSRPDTQEIITLRSGGTIDLYEISVTDNDNDNDDEEEEEEKTTLKLISRLETRSVLRSLGVVRVSGGKRDVIVVGSDSGCLSVVDFEGGVGRVLHCPVFGKSLFIRVDPAA